MAHNTPREVTQARLHIQEAQDLLTIAIRRMRAQTVRQFSPGAIEAIHDVHAGLSLAEKILGRIM